MFIWDKKIKEINGTTVSFEDWTQGEYTDTNLKYLQTEKVIEPHELEDKIVNECINDMLTVIYAHNLTTNTVNKVINKLPHDYWKNADFAICRILWVENMWDITAKMVSEWKNK